MVGYLRGCGFKRFFKDYLSRKFFRFCFAVRIIQKFLVIMDISFVIKYFFFTEF